MSFLSAMHNSGVGKVLGKIDPVDRVVGGGFANVFAPKAPGAPPSPPNQNDALNAAQSQADALRARRGMLSNIYAGGQNQTSSAPTTGTTQLGR